MELTDREQKLIKVINYLVRANSIFAVFEQHLQDTRLARNKTLQEANFTQEEYSKILDDVNTEFGTTYTFVRKEEVLEDGK